MVEIDRIYLLAKEKGLSNSFLCKKMNRSTSYLNDARNGKHGISEADLATIADILGTTTDYLHGKTDKKEKPDINAGLSDKELELLTSFRQLSSEEQDLFLKMFRGNQE